MENCVIEKFSHAWHVLTDSGKDVPEYIYIVKGDGTGKKVKLIIE